LIIDRIDLARLFIAYEKICPEDGTIYREGTCDRGHDLDEGITLEKKVREEPRYEIVRLQDISTGLAKRYKAFILLNEFYSRQAIREIIDEVTDQIKQETYQRNPQAKEKWQDSSAHVVVLYLGCNPDDIRTANWLCRTQWVDPELPDESSPIPLNGDEEHQGIEIVWNDQYEEWRQRHEQEKLGKGEYLEKAKEIVEKISRIADKFVVKFNQWLEEEISEKEFVSWVENHSDKVRKLDDQGGDLGYPPEDCDDFDLACQDLFTFVSQLFLYHTEDGRENWDLTQRVKNTEMAIDDYQKTLEKISLEEERIH
jgi:hypothetical protein